MNNLEHLSSHLTEHRLSRLSIWKMNIQAHIECAPAVAKYYFRKLMEYIGV